MSCLCLHGFHINPWVFLCTCTTSLRMLCVPQIDGPVGFTNRSCSCLFCGCSLQETHSLTFWAWPPLPPLSIRGRLLSNAWWMSARQGPSQPYLAWRPGLEETPPWDNRWDLGSRQIRGPEICSVCSRPGVHREARPPQPRMPELSRAAPKFKWQHLELF